MHESLRRTFCTLVVAAFLMALATPAIAAPRGEAATVPAFASTHAFADLMDWIGSWLDPTPVHSLAAPNGHALDPNGQPASPPSPSESAVTTEGEHATHPNR